MKFNAFFNRVQGCYMRFNFYRLRRRDLTTLTVL